MKSEGFVTNPVPEAPERKEQALAPKNEQAPAPKNEQALAPKNETTAAVVKNTTKPAQSLVQSALKKKEEKVELTPKQEMKVKITEI